MSNIVGAAVDFVVVKNTGSKVLRLKAGSQTYELESGDEQQIAASQTTYTIEAGGTTIGTISYPSAQSCQVKKGDQLSGAKFSATVEMTA